MPYGWTPVVAMTADLFHAFTGEPHPSTPKPEKQRDVSALAARLRAQKERLAAQTSAPPPTP